MGSLGANAEEEEEQEDHVIGDDTLSIFLSFLGVIHCFFQLQCFLDRQFLYIKICNHKQDAELTRKHCNAYCSFVKPLLLVKCSFLVIL